MSKQPEMVTALYYRAARKNDTNLNLDNQMYQLLSYAQQHGINSFALYADTGVSGLTLDRPALASLRAHIRARRVKQVIVASVDRISRNTLDSLQFVDAAAKYGAAVISIREGGGPLAESEIFSAIRSLVKGGEQE